MTQSNIDKPSMQDPVGTRHARFDLALETNMVVVVNERAQRPDHFGFPQTREGMNSSCGDWKDRARNIKLPKWW